MTPWEVAGIFGGIVLFGIAVGAPLLRLNSTITRLSTVLEIFQKRVDEDKKTNCEEHVAIWDKVETLEKTQGEHTTDIAVLKEKVG